MPIRRGSATNINHSDSLSKSSMEFKHKGRTVTHAKGGHHHHEALDPNKRYLSCRIVQGKGFVDFVNARDDEHLCVSVSFLRNRYHTKWVNVSTDPHFDETFIFEFVGENENIKFDPSMLLKLNQPLHITIMKQRKGDKPIVIGTKNVDWRSGDPHKNRDYRNRRYR